MMGALHPRYRHALCALESLHGWKFDGSIRNGNRREDVNVLSQRVDLRQTKSSPNYILSVRQVPFWTFTADRPIGSNLTVFPIKIYPQKLHVGHFLLIVVPHWGSTLSTDT